MPVAEHVRIYETAAKFPRMRGLHSWVHLSSEVISEALNAPYDDLNKPTKNPSNSRHTISNIFQASFAFYSTSTNGIL